MGADDQEQLAAVKARREVLRGWHETYVGTPEGLGWMPSMANSPMQRCRHCGASDLDYPEHTIEHETGCPVPDAQRRSTVPTSTG